MIAMCESRYAAVWANWHLRRTDELQPGGGVRDVACGRPFDGWDIAEWPGLPYDNHICPECLRLFTEGVSP